MTASVVVPLSNTDTTVTRLAAKAIIMDLMFSTEMENIEEIVYIPRGQIAAQSQYLTDEETLKLSTEDHISVEYNEIEDRAEFDFNKYQFEHAPIFNAQALGVSITPMHTRVNLELNITIYHKSYNTILSWINTFRRRNIRENPDLYHDLAYNYTVPTDVVTYLNQVYQLSENIAGYGLTLQEFIKNNSVPSGIGVRQNMIGTEHALTIHVKNTGCMGVFDGSIPDEPETSHEPPQSWVTFKYIVTYDRPTAVLLQYQKYIHNQVIDLEYIYKYADRRLHCDPHAGSKTFSQVVNQVTNFSNRYINEGYVKDGYINGDAKTYLDYNALAYGENAINITDGWVPSVSPANMLISQMFPVQLDLNNLFSLLDLNMLSVLGYPDYLMDLLKEHYDLLTNLYEWAFYIEVYEVNASITRIPVIVDKDFNLISIIKLNPRNRYYIRILINTDLMNVNFSALQKQPQRLTNLLQFINPNVTLKTIGNGAFVTNDSLWVAKNLIHSMNMKPFNVDLVQTTTILVGKRKN